ncbi:polymeric immunoglobulin receptor-like [Trachinotus anak]|uniref:polymeric immunoglobulin receptor-like n=1 Tax=Trachinotus anak TaxID=443729 RepID=UPI0039F1C62B
MAVWDRRTPWSFLLLLAGAVGQSVNYPTPVCAVGGSTVTLPCTFTPLMEIIRVVWCTNHLICHGSFPSVYDSESITNRPIDPRYQYLGDMTGNCTLQIRNLQRRDSKTFRFRMEGIITAGHFTGKSGVNVTVVDATPMRIISSSNETKVTEGQTLTLICTSVCTFHQLEVAWFRDDHALPESGPALRLSALTAEDSGKYTCGLKTGQPGRSVAYTLQVEAAGGEKGTTLDNLTIVHLVLFTAHTVLIIIVASIIIKRTCVCRRAADQQQRDK